MTTAGLRWQGQDIRVEHLVAPGGWLTTRGTHLLSCPCQCSEVQVCPDCGQPSGPASIGGRWDTDAGHTARQFDPVWVRLSCGCEFGDESLTRPATPENGEEKPDAREVADA